MSNPTHECFACLATTIQHAEEMAPPLVFAGSSCPNRPGIGHAWARIGATTASASGGIACFFRYFTCSATDSFSVLPFLPKDEQPLTLEELLFEAAWLFSFLFASDHWQDISKETIASPLTKEKQSLTLQKSPSSSAFALLSIESSEPVSEASHPSYSQSVESCSSNFQYQPHHKVD